ncbi:Dicer-like protein 2 [Mortierella sp. GBA43]|nr:Dicer-like protein 2 [Mortierella sp. GBA43]
MHIPSVAVPDVTISSATISSATPPIERDASANHHIGVGFAKCFAGTEAFVMASDRTPSGLTRMITGLYKNMDRSETAYGSYGETYHEEGSNQAKALIRSCTTVQLSQDSDWASFAAGFKSGLETSPVPSQTTIGDLQTKLGYTFSNPQLLADAIKIESPTSEELEFVGDAALELANARYWSLRHPGLDKPQRFSIKDASVCNSFLGFVALAQGLDHYFECDPDVQAKILVASASHIQAFIDDPSWGFWMEVNYPKNLGDAVEALFGAVYVDSGFSDDVVYHVFENLLVPFISSHILTKTVMMNPHEDLKAICRHTQVSVTKIQGITRCRVSLNGVRLGKGRSDKPQMARRVACRKALERVTKNREAFASHCRCFK